MGTVLALICGQMVVYLSEIGSTITCMVRVCTLGKTAESTREIISTTKSMVLASTRGQMADNITACGRKESNTEKANIYCHQECREEVSGVMVSVKSGSTRLLKSRLITH